MGQENVRPRIFVSRCLGFESCRWNGAVIPDKFVERLAAAADVVTACPEKDIGLGVPRNPVRIVRNKDTEYLMQLETEKDVTREMTEFSDEFLDGMGEVDGFVLKDRSPSCGLKDVKVYPGMGKHSPVDRTSGIFAQRVLERCPDTAVETEGRLHNFTIRESFLTRIFTSARFRAVRASGRIRDLVQFQAEHKLLLMAYSQKEMRLLGKITANHEHRDPAEVFAEYARHLSAAFQRPVRYASNINVLMHAFGYFSDQLRSEEKQYFLNTLEEYRREQIPLSVPLRLIQAQIVRFKEDYLRQQRFFEPYPPELVEITDSGKGRGA